MDILAGLEPKRVLIVVYIESLLISSIVCICLTLDLICTLFLYLHPLGLTVPLIILLMERLCFSIYVEVFLVQVLLWVLTFSTKITFLSSNMLYSTAIFSFYSRCLFSSMNQLMRFLMVDGYALMDTWQVPNFGSFENLVSLFVFSLHILSTSIILYYASLSFFVGWIHGDSWEE